MQTITVNGKTYSSPDEMPPEVRQIYEKSLGMLADKDQNGIPDFIEGSLGVEIPKNENNSVQVTAKRITVDVEGSSGGSEMPPEVRQQLDQARAELDQIMKDENQNGVPDRFEDMLKQMGTMSKRLASLDDEDSSTGSS